MALEIAAARPAVIINADAMQLVDTLRVITARPTEQEEAQAEHALYGVLPPSEPTSVARWLELAVPAIRRAWSEGKLPLLVGGTGMYLKALMEGIARIPPIPEPLRTELRGLSKEEVRVQLEAKDPVMAARLKPGDSQRNLRALEVIEATGTSLGEWQALGNELVLPEAGFACFYVDVGREEMYRRIDGRFEKMMQAGALEEVRALMAMDIPAGNPILRAHGVPELVRHLRGEMTLEAAVTKAQQHTRNYAKRQMTWLRNQLPDATPVTQSGQILAGLN